jgi:hypothetical protein
MISRNAHVIASDDLRVEVGGKLTIVGMYTGNIGIATDPYITPQMVFTFFVYTDVDDPFLSLTFEVTPPGENTPLSMNVSLPPLERRPKMAPESKGTIYRIPMFASSLTLRPGRVKARVIHERGEIEALGIPIIVRAPPQLPIVSPSAAPAPLPEDALPIDPPK